MTVVEIYKGGPRHRPESLTCILYVRLERIIGKRICHDLVKQTAILAAQREFTREFLEYKSLAFLPKATRRFDDGHKVEVCCMQFGQAFDSFNRDHLDHKTETSNIMWINVFLRRRALSLRPPPADRRSSVPH